MLQFGDLWLPVVLSAVATWILSSISWMVLPFHKGDYKKVSDEDGAMDALRAMGLSTGQYAVPQCGDMSKMKDPAFLAKLAKGPVATITVLPPGPPSMGKALGLWFAHALFAAFFAGYVARQTLPAGADGGMVFRITATVLMGIYIVSQIPPSIWMGRPWRASATQMIDGVLYSLAGGALFAWLWP